MLVFNIYSILTAKVAYNFERFDYPIVVEECVVNHSFEDCAKSYMDQLKAEYINIQLKKGQVDALLPTLNTVRRQSILTDIQHFNEYVEKFTSAFSSAKRIFLKVISAKTNGKKQETYFIHFQQILKDNFNSDYMVGLKRQSMKSFEKIMNFKK